MYDAAMISSLVKYSVCKCRLAFLEEGRGVYMVALFFAALKKGPVFVSFIFT